MTTIPLSKNYHKEQYQKFLDVLRQARLDSNLTQSQVAKLLGRSQDWVSRCETGEHRVDLVELSAFSEAYGKPISYFLSALKKGSKQ